MELPQLSQRQLEKFHKELKECCRTRNNFGRHMMVNNFHIHKRAFETNNAVRSAIRDEHIAAIILQGTVNEATSSSRSPIEIAIDAVLNEIKVVDWKTMSEKTIKDQAVRVVVKEKTVSQKKHLVITVYPDDGTGSFEHKKSLPKINCEVWND